MWLRAATWRERLTDCDRPRCDGHHRQGGIRPPPAGAVRRLICAPPSGNSSRS